MPRGHSLDAEILQEKILEEQTVEEKTLKENKDAPQDKRSKNLAAENDKLRKKNTTLRWAHFLHPT